MTTAMTLRTNDLDRYLAEVKRHPVLSRDEELSLAYRYRDRGDLEAAHALVVSNLRFVVKVAHEYRGYGLKLLDLIQEGTVGLMVAVKKFDPDRGYRLISYAVWWIRAHIQEFILKSWSMVKLASTRNKRRLFFKMRSTRSRLEREAQGEGVSSLALANELGVSESDVDTMSVRLAAKDFYLDTRLDDDSGTSHLDQLADLGANVEEQYAEAEEKHLLTGKVMEAMDGLSEREREIITRRILDDEPQTLQEIGDEFNVSRERIRQIESRALKKLRAAVGTAQVPAGAA